MCALWPEPFSASRTHYVIIKLTCVRRKLQDDCYQYNVINPIAQKKSPIRLIRLSESKAKVGAN